MVRAVAMLGLTIAILGVAARSARVIGWLLAAGVLAALFFPLVQALDKRLPRALALALVVVGSITLVGGVLFEVVHDVTSQVHDLQRAVPASRSPSASCSWPILRASSFWILSRRSTNSETDIFLRFILATIISTTDRYSGPDIPDNHSLQGTDCRGEYV